jgi:hypothetical protein
LLLLPVSPPLTVLDDGGDERLREIVPIMVRSVPRQQQVLVTVNHKTEGLASAFGIVPDDVTFGDNVLGKNYR